ncbi:MAG: transcription elongation factor GreA [Elusimicrobiota bacterium]
MPKEMALTKEGITELEDELTHLENVRRREIGDRIKEAKEWGDLSENSEYEDAKNEQAFVEARISEINQILANSTVITPPKRITKVILGSQVHLKDARDGSERRYRLVGSAEADPSRDKISNESPVGKALLGAKRGDVVKVTVPSGKVFAYEVLAVGR